jgi:hypothetical protein
MTDGYWLNEAAKLQGELELARTDREALWRDHVFLLSTILHIAMSAVESDTDRAKLQRDSWHKLAADCVKQLKYVGGDGKDTQATS